ncbi:MAG: tetratricopeptide repeat protein [Candidatus Omnitrophota bacterium]
MRNIMKTIVFFLVASFVTVKSFSQPDLSNSAQSQTQEGSKIEIIEIELNYREQILSGNNHLSSDNFDDAKNAFETALKISPDKPDAHINLGVVALKEKRYTDAKGLLSKALELAGGDYSKLDILFYNLGLCLYELGQYPDSADNFLKALEINPSFEEAKRGFDRSYDKIGKKIPEIEPKNDDENLNLSKESLIDDSETPLRKKDSISLSEEFLKSGSEAFQQKDLDKALELISESASINPNSPQAHFRLGIVYASKGEFAKAIECFKRTISLDPLFTKAYTNLGSAHGKLSQYPEALETLQKAKSLDKENPAIYYNMGMVYLAQGNRSKADGHFRKARKLCRKTNNHVLLSKIESLYVKNETPGLFE